MKFIKIHSLTDKQLGKHHRGMWKGTLKPCKDEFTLWVRIRFKKKKKA